MSKPCPNTLIKFFQKKREKNQNYTNLSLHCSAPLQLSSKKLLHRSASRKIQRIFNPASRAVAEEKNRHEQVEVLQKIGEDLSFLLLPLSGWRFHKR